MLRRGKLKCLSKSRVLQLAYSRAHFKVLLSGRLLSYSLAKLRSKTYCSLLLFTR